MPLRPRLPAKVLSNSVSPRASSSSAIRRRRSASHFRRSAGTLTNFSTIRQLALGRARGSASDVCPRSIKRWTKKGYFLASHNPTPKAMVTFAFASGISRHC
jgi:hypothetical protein